MALRSLARRYEQLQILDLPAAEADRPHGVRGTGGDATAVADRVVETITAEIPSQAIAQPGCDDELGGYAALPVADCGFALARSNPRACTDAVRWALARTDGPARWERKCLHFVARAHGWSASGVRSAADHWAQAPDRRPADPNPPAGALVFWDTGKRDGHVALSAGNGTVISTDIAGAGTVAVVDLSIVTERWNATYLGWTPPNFSHGV